MTKKNKMMLVSVGLITGLALFATTAFATIGNVSGYEAFKKASIKTATANNYTVAFQMELTENGESRWNEQSSFKTDGENFSSIMESDGYEFENHVQDGVMFYKKNDGTYGTYEHRIQQDSPADLSPAQIKFIELLADTLVGDTKNYVVSAGNNVSITLTENQIPQLAQVGLAAIGETSKKYTGRFTSDTDDISQIMLLNELSFKHFDFNGEISDEGFVENAAMTFTMGGFKQDGTYREVELSANIAVSDVGTTIPNQANLTIN